MFYDGHYGVMEIPKGTIVTVCEAKKLTTEQVRCSTLPKGGKQRKQRYIPSKFETKRLGLLQAYKKDAKKILY